MKTYQVNVYVDGSKKWRLNGNLHREDGPAVESSNGYKAWYLNGQCLLEKEFNERMMSSSCCSGKIVEYEGKKYKLVEV